jgi:hypothetical protein
VPCLCCVTRNAANHVRVPLVRPCTCATQSDACTCATESVPLTPTPPDALRCSVVCAMLCHAVPCSGPSPTLSPTDPVPRGLLTLWAGTWPSLRQPVHLPHVCPCVPTLSSSVPVSCRPPPCLPPPLPLSLPLPTSLPQHLSVPLRCCRSLGDTARECSLCEEGQGRQGERT